MIKFVKLFMVLGISGVLWVYGLVFIFYVFGFIERNDIVFLVLVDYVLLIIFLVLVMLNLYWRVLWLRL